MRTITINEKRALGLSAKHLSCYEEGGHRYLLEPSTLSAFIQLKNEARSHGFNLEIISAYRSFERQQRIWQEKLEGKRRTHDASGKTVDMTNLSINEKITAITRWSAIPGLSRHHFGTDIDIFDALGMDRNAVQLEPEEVEGNGPCAAMHDWLDERIKTNRSFGFFRPFTESSNTIAPERWHISYLPSAIQMLNLLQADTLAHVWQYYGVKDADILILEKDRWLKHFFKTTLKGQPEWVQDYFDSCGH